MRAVWRTAAVISVAVLGGAGCGSDDGASSQPATPSEASTPVAGEGLAGASTSPVVVAAANRRQAVLSSGGSSRRQGFVRVELRFRDALPGYDVRYVARPVRQDGSGAKVAVNGSDVLLVRMENATDIVSTNGDGPPARPRLPRAIGSVTDLVRVGGFEGVVTWAIGVDGRVPFRVRTAHRPSRLLVDVVDW